MKEHILNIGKTMIYRVENEFYIEVMIEDVRSAFGRIDYQIRPISGRGLKWVNSESVFQEL